MWKYEPKISFLRVACGSSVGDHSKSVLDTLAPIILSSVICVVAVVNWRRQGPSSWSRDNCKNRLVSATRCRIQTGTPQNYFYYTIDWSRDRTARRRSDKQETWPPKPRSNDWIVNEHNRTGAGCLTANNGCTVLSTRREAVVIPISLTCPPGADCERPPPNTTLGDC